MNLRTRFARFLTLERHGPGQLGMTELQRRQDSDAHGGPSSSSRSSVTWRVTTTSCIVSIGIVSTGSPQYSSDPTCLSPAQRCTHPSRLIPISSTSTLRTFRTFLFFVFTSTSPKVLILDTVFLVDC
ncbi:hypothetical protein JCM8097_000033 [Rhodosporidiobolus ruineniae]